MVFVPRGKLLRGLIRVGEKIRFCVLELAIFLGGFMMGCLGATLVYFFECVVVFPCC